MVVGALGASPDRGRGAGHLPNLERPGDFNERLLDFLTRARPR